MTRKIRILISESDEFSVKALEILHQVGDVILADLDRDGLFSALRGVDVLWVRLRNQIDDEIMTRAPDLKIIVSPTTGLNHIDTDAAKRHKIEVLSLRGEGEFLRDVRATAEHTIALILALLRRLPAAVEHVASGGWNRNIFKGQELLNKTVGIVGYGRLGKLVAGYLKAFDARVIATDPNETKDISGTKMTFLPLIELLNQSDIVTAHVDLNAHTHGLFGQKEFMSFKGKALFINTSRGELVQEGALLDALRSGKLDGAALDVLCEERQRGMEHNPLVAYARGHKNLIITPHIGGCTKESVEKTELFLAEKLKNMLVSSLS